jgi:hypothetical protein
LLFKVKLHSCVPNLPVRSEIGFNSVKLLVCRDGLLEELLSMVKGLYFLFALLNPFSELGGSVEVFADIDILSKLLDFLQLPLQVDQLFVEDFLLILKLLRQFCFSLLDDPLGFSNGILDPLRPLLEPPEAAKGQILNFVQIFFKHKEIAGDGLYLVLQFLHCGVIFTDQLVKLFKLVLVKLRGFIGGQLFLALFVGLLDVLDAFATNLMDLLQNLVHDLNCSVDENLLGAFGSDLEQSAVDFIDGDLFQSLFGIVDLR